MSFLGRFNSSAASPGGSPSKTRPPVRTSSRSAETTGAGGRASLAPSSGLAADLIQPIKFSASPFLPPSPNLVSDPAQFSPDFSSSFDPTFTTVRTPGSSTGLLDAGRSPWVDVKSENPGSEGRPKISGSRGVKERAREEDRLLGKAKLGVEKVTVLIRETSEVIREQGLTTLGLLRPYRASESPSIIRGLCLSFLDYSLAPPPLTVVAPTSTDGDAVVDALPRELWRKRGTKLDKFRDEIRHAGVVNVACLLKWGLRHLTYHPSSPFSTSSPSSPLYWYTRFVNTAPANSCVSLLATLPPTSAALLEQLLPLMTSILSYTDSNAMTARKLCLSLGLYVFGLSGREFGGKAGEEGFGELYQLWKEAGTALEGCLRAYLAAQETLTKRLREVLDAPMGDGARRVRAIKIELEYDALPRAKAKVNVNDQATGKTATLSGAWLRASPSDLLLRALGVDTFDGLGSEELECWKGIRAKWDAGERDPTAVLDDETRRVLQLVGLGYAAPASAAPLPSPSLIPVASNSTKASLTPVRSSSIAPGTKARKITPSWNEFATSGFASTNSPLVNKEFGRVKPAAPGARRVSKPGLSVPVDRTAEGGRTSIVAMRFIEIEAEFLDVYLDTLVDPGCDTWPSLFISLLRPSLAAEGRVDYLLVTQRPPTLVASMPVVQRLGGEAASVTTSTTGTRAASMTESTRRKGFFGRMFGSGSGPKPRSPGRSGVGGSSYETRSPKSGSRSRIAPIKESDSPMSTPSKSSISSFAPPPQIDVNSPTTPFPLAISRAMPPGSPTPASGLKLAPVMLDAPKSPPLVQISTPELEQAVDGHVEGMVLIGAGAVVGLGLGVHDMDASVDEGRLRPSMELPERAESPTSMYSQVDPEPTVVPAIKAEPVPIPAQLEELSIPSQDPAPPAPVVVQQVKPIIAPLVLSPVVPLEAIHEAPPSPKVPSTPVRVSRDGSFAGTGPPSPVRPPMSPEREAALNRRISSAAVAAALMEPQRPLGQEREGVVPVPVAVVEGAVLEGTAHNTFAEHAAPVPVDETPIAPVVSSEVKHEGPAVEETVPVGEQPVAEGAVKHKVGEEEVKAEEPTVVEEESTTFAVEPLVDPAPPIPVDLVKESPAAVEEVVPVAPLPIVTPPATIPAPTTPVKSMSPALVALSTPPQRSASMSPTPTLIDPATPVSITPSSTSGSAKKFLSTGLGGLLRRKKSNMNKTNAAMLALEERTAKDLRETTKAERKAEKVDSPKVVSSVRLRVEELEAAKSKERAASAAKAGADGSPVRRPHSSGASGKSAKSLGVAALALPVATVTAGAGAVMVGAKQAGSTPPTTQGLSVQAEAPISAVEAPTVDVASPPPAAIEPKAVEPTVTPTLPPSDPTPPATLLVAPSIPTPVTQEVKMPPVPLAHVESAAPVAEEIIPTTDLETADRSKVVSLEGESNGLAGSAPVSSDAVTTSIKEGTKVE